MNPVRLRRHQEKMNKTINLQFCREKPKKNTRVKKSHHRARTPVAAGDGLIPATPSDPSLAANARSLGVIGLGREGVALETTVVVTTAIPSQATPPGGGTKIRVGVVARGTLLAKTTTKVVGRRIRKTVNIAVVVVPRLPNKLGGATVPLRRLRAPRVQANLDAKLPSTSRRGNISIVVPCHMVSVLFIFAGGATTKLFCVVFLLFVFL